MKRPTKKSIREYLKCDSFCPWCGNNDIDVDGDLQSEVSIAWQSCYCNACNKEWYDEYKLVAISWMEDDSPERVYSDEDMGIKV